MAVAIERGDDPLQLLFDDRPRQKRNNRITDRVLADAERRRHLQFDFLKTVPIGQRATDKKACSQKYSDEGQQPVAQRHGQPRLALGSYNECTQSHARHWLPGKIPDHINSTVLADFPHSRLSV